MRNLLLLLPFLLFSCATPRGLFVVEKGEHHSKPFHVNIVPTNAGVRYGGELIILPKTRYCINDNCEFKGDQKDWNKVCGANFGTKPAYNTMLLGLRDNTKIDSIEIVPYLNVEGNNFPKYEYKINASVGDTIKYFFIYYSGDLGCQYWLENKRTGQKTNYLEKKIWKEKFNLCYDIKPYFGGTSTAPSDWEIFLKKTEYKSEPD